MREKPNKTVNREHVEKVSAEIAALNAEVARLERGEPSATDAGMALSVQKAYLAAETQTLAVDHVHRFPAEGRRSYLSKRQDGEMRDGRVFSPKRSPRPSPTTSRQSSPYSPRLVGGKATAKEMVVERGVKHVHLQAPKPLGV